jgi:hypothetical protein
MMLYSAEEGFILGTKTRWKMNDCAIGYYYGEEKEDESMHTQLCEQYRHEAATEDSNSITSCACISREIHTYNSSEDDDAHYIEAFYSFKSRHIGYIL